MLIRESSPPDRLDDLTSTFRVEPYRRDRHLKHIESWLIERALSLSLAEELPEIGFVALEGERGIAAGFIRRLENCSYALADSLISNPLELASLRDRALTEIIRSLIREAKERNIRQLFAATQDIHTLERVLYLGFQKLPYQALGINLEELKL